ncbi:unnamed protein product [Linum trigynum]|uniref:Uncharacterized protein n=1 Tax=Linum trigynum TaxID=586398 RepID=A0AAV2EAR4_9ROSI
MSGLKFLYVAELVFDTYKEGDIIKDVAANARHAKMVETIEANPEFTSLEVIEASIGEQNRGHVICFGGGLKPRDLKVPTSTSNAREAILEDELRRSDEQNDALEQTVTDLMDTVSSQAGELTDMKAEMQRLKQMVENSKNRQN